MIHDEEIEQCLARVSVDDAIGARQRSAVKARLFDSHGGPTRTQLDRFVIRRELGRGGMGKVYEAYDPKLDRAVAIKILRERQRAAEDRRLLREAQALARLSHPNVVQVHEVGEIDGDPFIVMEQVPGVSLADWQHPDHHWSECLDVYLQAGRGLAAAHAVGLVHRDFKPSNCILDEQGRVRVLDFGLARVDSVPPGESAPTSGSFRTRVEGQEDRTKRSADWSSSPPISAGVVAGTLGYIAPELRRGRAADHRSDQFSFCVSLYEALFDQPPFGDDEHSLPAAPPRRHPAPGWLRRALRRGLSADPAARWPSMKALLSALDRGRRRSRLRRIALVAVVVAVVLLGGSGWSLRSNEDEVRSDGRTACPTEMDLRRGVWSESTQLEVQESLRATDRPHAPATWRRVQDGLGRYVDDWARYYRGACESRIIGTLTSASPSESTLRCLRGRRAHIVATVNLLAHADGRIVDEAVSLVEGLPPLDECERNGEISGASTSPLARRVRVSLADVEALQRVGRYADALQELEPLVEEARKSGDVELVTEILVRRGMLQADTGEFDGARHTLERAYTVALEHEFDRLAFVAAARLARQFGFIESKHSIGLTWASSAMGLARRRGEALEEANVYQILADILRDQGRYREAEGLYHYVLAKRALLLGPQHRRVGDTHHGLAVVLLEQARFEAAEEHAMEALETRRSSLGERHPKVAHALMLLSRIENRSGDCAAAEELARDANDIYVQIQSQRSPTMAKIQVVLGNALACQGDLAAAGAAYRKALTLGRGFSADPELDPHRLEGSLANVLARQGRFAEAEKYVRRRYRSLVDAGESEHPELALLLTNLGHFLMGQRRFDEAEHAYRRAQQIEKAHRGPNHPDVASVATSLGFLLAETGRPKAARRHLLAALRIQEDALEPNHRDTARTLVGLAHVAVNLGEFVSARRHAKRALAILDEPQAPPELLAAAHFALARAMRGSGSPSIQACVLARRAVDAYAHIGAGADIERNRVERWLKACRGR